MRINLLCRYCPSCVLQIINPFPTGHRTVVIGNLPHLASEETEAQHLDKVKCVISERLSLPGIEVIVVTKGGPPAARGNNPGLVLAEFPSVDDKKTVLCAKLDLRNSPAYNNLYIRSAEDHTDKLLRMNFQTLVDYLDLTRHFRFTGSCRLVPRDRPAASYQNQRPSFANSDDETTRTGLI